MRRKASYGGIPAWVRVLLSVGVAFHLMVVVLMPNSNTWLGLKALSWLDPYVKALELTPSWNFFAPDPGPPPIFVEWELEDAGGNSIGKGIFPERWDPYVFRERQNRRIAMTRFMVLNDLRTEKIMLDYLCRENPNASSIQLWRTAYSTPSLDAVARGERRIGDDQGAQRIFVSHSFCEGRST